MKKLILILTASVMIFTLAACGGKNEQSANATATIEAVHTRVAVTLTAQAAQFTPTSQAAPTQAPPATATPAPAASPTPRSEATSSVNLPVQNKPDSASFMTDITVPDDTIFAPGANFTKTWQMYNNGTTTWSTEYKLVFVSGNAMSGATTKISQSVAPGGSANISVAMTAPTEPGTYKGFWKMQNTAGTWFGDQIYIQIVVSNNGSATATATIDPSVTITATVEPAWVSYTIKDGDSCESIALAHNTTWDVIKAYNGLSEYCAEVNFQSHIGETIKVPEW